ncbi:MAG: glycosyltransferase [bacterium]|nr:glycosyltransferase [bacterium]MDD5757126.1 glycosyltransferase [bacterium]
MNILFLSTKSPLPTNDGHSQRTYNLLLQAGRKHKVFFLTYFLEKEEEERFSEIQKICSYAKGFPLPVQHSKIRLVLGLLKNLFSLQPFVSQKYCTVEMAKAIKKILNENKIDVVHIDMLPLMSYYPEVKNYPVILVDHNVESLLLKRQIAYTRNPFTKVFLWSQYLKLLRFERKQIARVSCCVAVSGQDRDELRKMSASAKVEVVSNGVDVDYFAPGDIKEEKNTLIFVGGLNWFPNMDGITYFCEKIYPRIAKQCGEFETIIIGKQQNVFKYSSLVRQVGYVDDIRPYVRKSKVYIVPLRVGGGTRLKILDAMAMGKSIVSTSIGCEGLAVENNKNIMIQDDPELFASAVVELMKNEQKRIELGNNARQLVKDQYDWKLLGEIMDKIYKNCEK